MIQIMRNVLIALSLCVFFANCSDGSTAGKALASNDTISTKRAVTQDTAGVVKKDTTVAPQLVHKNDLASRILGAWATAGAENANFVIEKKKITYPEHFKSYKYTLANDSIKIKYDTYADAYLIKMQGADTLMLIGDEPSTYYRFKK